MTERVYAFAITGTIAEKAKDQSFDLVENDYDPCEVVENCRSLDPVLMVEARNLEAQGRAMAAMEKALEKAMQ